MPHETRKRICRSLAMLRTRNWKTRGASTATFRCDPRGDRHVQENSDRQPRRDRLPRDQDRPQDGHQDRRRVFRGRQGRAHVAGRRGRAASARRPSKESIWSIDKIIAACKQTGAEAVHPGYGFLSENAAFSRAWRRKGIVFIGPKHYSIAAMGDKIASKKLAMEAGVNTIPGFNEDRPTPEQAVEIARDIGYPVMIKASAGGGGKGLRVAFNDKEGLRGL
jgi:pyruvate carboxylase